jgi:hydrogenase/urease accessory protein HupE
MLIDLAEISRIVFVAVSTIIFGITLTTFSRFRTKKTLLLTIGFGLFFVHGIISIPELFNQAYNTEFTEDIHLLIDAVAILFLLLGTLKD